MKRGEIWWADLPPPTGSEPGYRRPVLVLQSDSFNRSKIGMIVVAALSTNLDLARAPGNVAVSPQETGLDRESVINVTQILSADKRLFSERIGRVSDRVMHRVEEGIRLVLDL